MNYQLNYQKNPPRPIIRQTLTFIVKHWFQLLLVCFALHILFNKEVNIQVNLSDKGSQLHNLPEQIGKTPLGDKIVPAAITTSLKEAPPTTQNLSLSSGSASPKKHTAPTDNRANHFRNLTFILSPSYAQRHGIPKAAVEEKMNHCRQYVERFAAVAISEMKKYGIPASITLAQGLLESDAGDSKLSVESNNHFGIKCRAKCKGCTCRNYTDDNAYDMFRVFGTIWESYREHSILLNSSRYQHLKKLGQKDYKGWAHGLKKAGYATDKNYAKKLIQIIETLDLYQFDQ